jgi:DNA-binding FadR family transcriptional regulator
MKVRGSRYDWAGLEEQVKASTGADLLSNPDFFKALRFAEIRKLIEPGAVELARELINAQATAPLRDLLQDSFEEALENAPTAQADTPSAGTRSSTA